MKYGQKKGPDLIASRARCQLKHASEDCIIILKRRNRLDRKKVFSIMNGHSRYLTL